MNLEIDKKIKIHKIFLLFLKFNFIKKRTLEIENLKKKLVCNTI